MALTLEKIQSSDIPVIHDLLVHCGEHMYRQMQLSHWYPFMDIEKFKLFIQEKETYKVTDSGSCVATFNLSNTPRDYYDNDLWTAPQANAAYFGNLAISPEKQGAGLGKWCMLQADELALKMGASWIRFDALESHPWLCAFYQKLGYTRKKNLTVANKTLTCFEKKVLN